MKELLVSEQQAAPVESDPAGQQTPKVHWSRAFWVWVKSLRYASQMLRDHVWVLYGRHARGSVSFLPTRSPLLLALTGGRVLQFFTPCLDSGVYCNSSVLSFLPL